MCLLWHPVQTPSLPEFANVWEKVRCPVCAGLDLLKAVTAGCEWMVQWFGSWGLDLEDQ